MFNLWPSKQTINIIIVVFKCTDLEYYRKNYMDNLKKTVIDPFYVSYFFF